MPLIRLDDMAEDLEDKAVKRGKYDLVIAKAEYKETKKGGDFMLALMLKIEGEEGIGAKPVNLMLMDPSKTDDAAIQRMRKRDLKRFMVAFGIDGLDMETQAEELQGLTAKGITLTEETYEGEVNNRVQLPKVV